MDNEQLTIDNSGGARTAGCASNFVSFRASAHTGVGISIVIETALRLKKEIATPACALVRNDSKFETAFS